MKGRDLMKKVLKIFLFIVLVLLICGCDNKEEEKWKDVFQVSELKFDGNYIVGKVKNTKDKAYDITIYFELQSGSLIEEEFDSEVIKPNEIIDIKTLVYGYDDSYDIKLKKIEYKEKEIPKLDYDNIDIETLKYYFEDIYDKHLSITSFRWDLQFDEDLNYYPYIDEIKYQSYDDTINIKYSYFDSETLFQIYISDSYSTKDEELQTVYININHFDETLLSKIQSSIIRGVTDDYSYNSSYNYYLNEEVELGKCWVVNDWCISRRTGADGGITFCFELKD